MHSFRVAEVFHRMVEISNLEHRGSGQDREKQVEGLWFGRSENGAGEYVCMGGHQGEDERRSDTA